jgi:VWFA-related protein
MTGRNHSDTRASQSVPNSQLGCLFLLILILAVLAPAVFAQNGAAPASGAQSGSGSRQPAPAEAGGPDSDVGPYAIPKAAPDTRSARPAPLPAPKPPEDMPKYAINVDVPLVSLDVLVLTKEGQFIPGLQPEQFRVMEDGVVQPIQNFGVTKAGYTAVLLVEFASTPAFQVSRRQFLIDALHASYAFTDQMQKDDYVSVISYDVKPSILVDFTPDKQAVYAALNSLRIPGFSETNLYDALYDTLDRLERIEGRKEIILIGSGLDSFSKIRFDQLLKKIKATQDVTIYCISTGFLWREYAEARPTVGASISNMDFLQADNQMKTFAEMTGGRWFSPRLQGELPDDFREISSAVRNQYTLAYRPTNSKLDGTYRKLKVQLVQPGTDKPLIVKNEKGKDLKYQVITRAGYTAKHQVE